MPEKLAKRSRRIGSPKPSNTPAKKRGRPPKTESAPVPTPEPTDSLQDAPKSPSNTALAPIPQNQPQKPVEAYTALTQVPHGLTIPTFDPNSYLPTDLTKDTSPLERTTKATADETVQSIQEKRETMRVVLANQGLVQDVIKGGMEHRKIEGLAIDFDSLRITNETKFVNWQTTGLNRDIAVNKWQQTTEKLIQGQAVLAGMQAITPLITEEWNERKALKVASINKLKSKAMSDSTAMDAKLANTIDNMNSNDSED